MKVIVSDMAALGRYVSREFYFVMRELVERYGWRQVETSEVSADRRPLAEALAARLGGRPTTVLFWEGYDFLSSRAADVLAADCRKCIFADDLHSWDPGMKQRKRNAFLMCDTVLATYAYAVEAFFPSVSRSRRVVWVPHSASPDFMVPFDETPENAVLVSGAVTPHYPLRRRAWALGEAGSRAVARRAHPGYHCEYDHAADDRVGAGYARTVGRYRAALADAPVYGYLVAKFFEIPAAGALLLGDRSVAEPFAKLGFVDGRHYVSVSRDDLEERIDYVLDERNRAALDEVRREGRRHVWAAHAASDRARLIDEACGS